MSLISYPDSEMLMIDLAGRIAEELENALHHHDRVTLAVPGGTTPGPLFDELSAADIAWPRIDVILTDERRVPSDHERSNERLLRERLLVGRAAEANFVRLVPDEKTPDKTVENLAELLPVSVLLLGMGEDMHTASIFPGSPHLEAALDRNAPPLLQVDAPGGLEPRITLAGHVLRNAVVSHVLIIGPAKKEAYERALRLNATQAPIALVLSEATTHWAPE